MKAGKENFLIMIIDSWTDIVWGRVQKVSF